MEDKTIKGAPSKVDQLGKITLINGDCMDYMRTLPDNAFDLAIVDPPYGDGKLLSDNQIGGADCGSTEGTDGTSIDLQPLRRDILSVPMPPPESVTRTGGTWATKYGKKYSAVGYCS